MRGKRVKKIRSEIRKQNLEYTDSIQTSVSELTLVALFALPFWRRIKFAFGLVFLPFKRLFCG
jgi:hypothetical protein